jgi:hypothetical protein
VIAPVRNLIACSSHQVQKGIDQQPAQTMAEIERNLSQNVQAAMMATAGEVDQQSGNGEVHAGHSSAKAGRSSVYNTWPSMMDLCSNPKARKFSYQASRHSTIEHR